MIELTGAAPQTNCGALSSIGLAFDVENMGVRNNNTTMVFFNIYVFGFGFAASIAATRAALALSSSSCNALNVASVRDPFFASAIPLINFSILDSLSAAKSAIRVIVYITAACTPKEARIDLARAPICVICSCVIL